MNCNHIGNARHRTPDAADGGNDLLCVGSRRSDTARRTIDF
jgi:hypothetical protein